MKRIPRVALLLMCAILLAALLAACNSGDGGGIADILPGGGDEPELSNPEFVREPPPIEPHLAQFNPEIGPAYDDGETTIFLDTTYAASGYVGVRATAPVKGLFLVKNLSREGTAEYKEYPYILDTTGRDRFYPLAMGNGTYELSVMIFAYTDEAGKDQWYPRVQVPLEVNIEDERLPFTVNSTVVDYSPDSPAVALSYEVAQHASTKLEVIQQVYAWIQENIEYDTDRAAFVQTEEGRRYVPDLTQVLTDKKGICYDYASLAAAMLRANDIPCKMIFGNVNTGAEGGVILHAWNLIWTEEAGWIAVKVPSGPGEWSRIDLTFAASGGASISEFIGNAENYVELSVH